MAAGACGSGSHLGGAGGAGTQPCAAEQERCNGFDDDCDGEIDEEDPELGQACPDLDCASASLGCQEGELVCIVPAVTVEQCNGIDDDCDGDIDEEDAKIGTECDAGGTGACAKGELACVEGELVCADPGPVPETCNWLDDDCNGQTDDPYGVCKKIVFATSDAYTGNLGGLEGADTICMYHAELGGLAGVFKAWLSSSTLAAKDRLTHLGRPYVLVDETVIAQDWNDLTNDTIQHMIDLNEVGGPPAPGSYSWWLSAPLIWTASWGNGEFDDNGLSPNDPPSWATCLDWTTTSGTPPFGRGGSANTDPDTSNWTHGWDLSCQDSFALYCFQQ